MLSLKQLLRSSKDADTPEHTTITAIDDCPIWKTDIFADFEQSHLQLSEPARCHCVKVVELHEARDASEASDTIWEIAIFSEFEEFHATLSEHAKYFRLSKHERLKARYVPGICDTSHLYNQGSLTCLPMEKKKVEGSGTSELHKLEILACIPVEMDNAVAWMYTQTTSTAHTINAKSTTNTGSLRSKELVFSPHTARISTGFPLTSCFDLPHDHDVFSMKPKSRMALAVYVTYAYYHLGGGCWLPYDHAFQIPAKIKQHKQPPVFFVPTPCDGDNNHSDASETKTSRAMEQVNKTMPNMVGLGKFILEMCLGRAVDLEDVRRRVAQRQNLMQTGFKITREHIFPSIASSDLELDNHKKAPVSAIPVDSTKSNNQTEFCLYDDGTSPSKLEQGLARAADDYMKKLKKCANIAMNNILAKDTSSRDAVMPVKVAIIDTGANLPSDYLVQLHTYNGERRLWESRSWLSSEDGKDGRHIGSNCDGDGHGTHAASVFLEATEDTTIELYVAQVFESRSVQYTEDELRDDERVKRIADAIDYAVDRWHVDIISMSFGFSKAVASIANSIKYAASSGVICCAAASNCGQNHLPSWPACDDRVICVYAADGHGIEFARNPPASKHWNIATLGVHVEAYWPPDREGRSKRQRKTGTSTATPIGAAIIALIFTMLRRSKAKYVDKEQFRSALTNYDAMLEDLCRTPSIMSVLEAMSHTTSEKTYITLWKYLNEEVLENEDHARFVIKKIAENINA